MFNLGSLLIMLSLMALCTPLAFLGAVTGISYSLNAVTAITPLTFLITVTSITPLAFLNAV